jgi:hypothetical protein
MASRHHQTLRKNGAAVDRMRGSIREFEFKIPAQARRDGEVVDGHLLLKAAPPVAVEGDIALW